MTANLIEQLAAALAPALDAQKARQYAYKHDVSSATPAGGIFSHGPGGLLTFPGVDPVAFNAAMGPRSILGQIPTMPSVYTNPTYLTITGVTDVTGDEADGICDDAPVAGLMKGCMTTSVFGLYMRATPIIELNRLGQRNDRADPLDLRLVGSPLAQNGPFAGIGSSANPTDVLTNEMTRKFWERNVAFYRLLSKQVWVGNPSNNGGGANPGYKEMTGLDVLINTGHVDAETGAACPAMDSYVRNFGHLNTNSDAGAAAIVREITNLYYQMVDRATRMNLMPVRWVFAMRPQLFYELTSIWPCSYLTFGCRLDSTNENINVDAQDAVALRDAMRSGEYLLINGVRVDVILDDGIAELGIGNGVFSSNIYLIPMSVVGGQAVTFMEYFQFQNPSLSDALGNMILGRIEGAFLTWPRQTNLCIQWQSKIEPRMVLRTPWLAARLDNVGYQPLDHTRDVFPDDPYFVNGGKTSRVGPSYFNIWSSQG